jgi:iron complex outermembrane receptor protein
MKQFLILFFLFISANLLAQEVRLSGTLTDATTQEPIPNASIVVKNKTIGTSTNAKGQFT